MATFALQSCLVCSILRILSLQLGASVVIVDGRFPIRSICSIFVVCRSAFIPAYPCSIQPLKRYTYLSKLMQECHGVFDTCHQHVVLLALVRLLRSRLSYAGLLYIKLTTVPVTIECIHAATSCQSLKDNRKHNHTEVILKLGLLGRG